MDILVDSIFDWLTSCIRDFFASLLDLLVDTILGKNEHFRPTLDFFKRTLFAYGGDDFTLYNKFADIFVYIGWTLFMIISFLTLIMCVSGAIKERRQTVGQAIIRILVAFVILFFQAQITEFAMDEMAAPIYDSVVERIEEVKEESTKPPATDGTYLQSELEEKSDLGHLSSSVLGIVETLATGGAILGGKLIFKTLLEIIFLLLFGYNLIKLAVEIIQHYVTVCCLCISAPVFIPFMISDDTSRTSSAYWKMFLTELGLLVFNRLWVGAALTVYARSDASIPVLGFIVVLAFLRVGQNLNGFAARLNLTTAGMSMSLLDCTLASGFALTRAATGIARMGSGVRVGIGQAAQGYGSLTGKTGAIAFGNALCRKGVDAASVLNTRNTNTLGQVRNNRLQNGKARVTDSEAALFNKGITSGDMRTAQAANVMRSNMNAANKSELDSKVSALNGFKPMGENAPTPVMNGPLGRDGHMHGQMQFANGKSIEGDFSMQALNSNSRAYKTQSGETAFFTPTNPKNMLQPDNGIKLNDAANPMSFANMVAGEKIKQAAPQFLDKDANGNEFFNPAKKASVKGISMTGQEWLDRSTYIARGNGTGEIYTEFAKGMQRTNVSSASSARGVGSIEGNKYSEHTLANGTTIGTISGSSSVTGSISGQRKAFETARDSGGITGNTSFEREREVSFGGQSYNMTARNAAALRNAGDVVYSGGCFNTMNEDGSMTAITGTLNPKMQNAFEEGKTYSASDFTFGSESYAGYVDGSYLGNFSCEQVQDILGDENAHANHYDAGCMTFTATGTGKHGDYAMDYESYTATFDESKLDALHNEGISDGCSFDASWELHNADDGGVTLCHHEPSNDVDTRLTAVFDANDRPTYYDGTVISHYDSNMADNTYNGHDNITAAETIGAFTETAGGIVNEDGSYKIGGLHESAIRFGQGYDSYSYIDDSGVELAVTTIANNNNEKEMFAFIHTPSREVAGQYLDPKSPMQYCEGNAETGGGWFGRVKSHTEKDEDGGRITVWDVLDAKRAAKNNKALDDIRKKLS